MNTEQAKQVMDKVALLGNTLGANDLTDAKKDVKDLDIGVRKDGGPQTMTRKKSHFKPNELDLSKYMSSGHSIDTQKLAVKRNLM